MLRVISRHTVEDPITGASVELATGVSAREVTDIVTAATQEGVPVGSCTRGYFRWRNNDERQLYIRQEENRIKALGRKTAALKKAALGDELTLFEQEAAA